MTGLLGQLLPVYIICARALAGRPTRYARSHAFTHCLSDLHVVYGVRYRGTVMTTIVNERRKAIPVNTEPPLESAPELQFRPMWSGDAPACSAPNGTIYYANGQQSDGSDPGANTQPFDDSLRIDFRKCAVRGDGTVYEVGLTEEAPLSLNAFEPTAQLKWSVPAQDVCSRPALGPDGSVYVVSRTRAGTTILTGYGAGGSKLWETPIGGTGWNLAAPVIAANGTIYVSATSQLVAIESTGREIWRVSVQNAGSEDASGLIAGDDGRIFVQVLHGVIAFNERGEKLWEFLAGSRDLDGGIALGATVRCTLRRDSSTHSIKQENLSGISSLSSRTQRAIISAINLLLRRMARSMPTLRATSYMQSPRMAGKSGW